MAKKKHPKKNAPSSRRTEKRPIDRERESLIYRLEVIGPELGEAKRHAVLIGDQKTIEVLATVGKALRWVYNQHSEVKQP